MLPTVSSVDSLATRKQLHTPIYNLAPTVSSSSLTPIQILCLSKAQAGINKRSALEVMEDKQRQVVQDCEHKNVSVWTRISWWCVLARWRRWWSSMERGAAAWLGPERRLFVWILWQKGVGERRQAGSIQHQHFPMWPHNTHKPAEQRNHTLSSVHLLHSSLSHTCLVYLWKMKIQNTWGSSILFCFPRFSPNNIIIVFPAARRWWSPWFTLKEVNEDNSENASGNRKWREKWEENANELLIM